NLASQAVHATGNDIDLMESAARAPPAPCNGSAARGFSIRSSEHDPLAHLISAAAPMWPRVYLTRARSDCTLATDRSLWLLAFLRPELEHARIAFPLHEDQRRAHARAGDREGRCAVQSA